MKKEEAIKLRLFKRLTNREIATKLGVSYNTAAVWVREHPLTYEERRGKMFLGGAVPRPEFDEKTRLNRYEERLKWFGLGIYAGEGTKSDADVSICNSDPVIVLCFLKFLRKLFRINERRLRASLQLKDFHDAKKMTRWWSSITRIPISQFTKPVVTKSNPRKDGKRYLGTCRVRYADQTLWKRIMVLIKEMGLLPSGIANESVKLVSFD
jgi:hypothetical protein